jgi:hypothetical protein
MADEPAQPNPLNDEREAIKRIAMTGDGALLHRHLRRVLEMVTDLPKSGALREHNGRRSLARDLMAMMAEGIETNRDRRNGTADEPILKRGERPAVADPAGRGARRRVRLSDGDGWKRPAD